MSHSLALSQSCILQEVVTNTACAFASDCSIFSLFTSSQSRVPSTSAAVLGAHDGACPRRIPAQSSLASYVAPCERPRRRLLISMNGESSSHGGLALPGRGTKVWLTGKSGEFVLSLTQSTETAFTNGGRYTKEQLSSFRSSSTTPTPQSEHTIQTFDIRTAACRQSSEFRPPAARLIDAKHTLEHHRSDGGQQ